MNQQRLTRVLAMLGRLSPHSQITIKEFSEIYEVSERTIARDVDCLRDAQLGVYCDENERLKISRFGYQKIKSIMLS